MALLFNLYFGEWNDSLLFLKALQFYISFYEKWVDELQPLKTTYLFILCWSDTNYIYKWWSCCENLYNLIGFHRPDYSNTRKIHGLTISGELFHSKIDYEPNQILHILYHWFIRKLSILSFKRGLWIWAFFGSI